MQPTDFVAIVVSAIAAASAWASQRAAAKASTTNTATTSRVDLEKEAYIRARAFDTATIERQEEEIQELREEVKGLRTDAKVKNDKIDQLEAANRAQAEEIRILMARITRLEVGVPIDTEELIRERAIEADHSDPEQ